MGHATRRRSGGSSQAWPAGSAQAARQCSGRQPVLREGAEKSPGQACLPISCVQGFQVAWRPSCSSWLNSAYSCQDSVPSRQLRSCQAASTVSQPPAARTVSGSDPHRIGANITGSDPSHQLPVQCAHYPSHQLPAQPPAASPVWHNRGPLCPRGAPQAKRHATSIPATSCRPQCALLAHEGSYVPSRCPPGLQTYYKYPSHQLPALPAQCAQMTASPAAASSLASSFPPG